MVVAQSQGPRIMTENGQIMFQDDVSPPVSLGNVAGVTGRIQSRTGTGPIIPLGKMSPSDMPRVTVSYQGCADSASLEATFVKSGTRSVNANVQSSAGLSDNADGLDDEPFANSVQIYAGPVSGGAATGLRMEVEDSCLTATWTAVFNSVTGDFDPDFDYSSGGAVITTREMASLEVAQAYTDDAVAVVNRAAVNDRARSLQFTTDLQASLDQTNEALRALTRRVTANESPCPIPSGVPASGVGSLTFSGDAVPGTLAKYVCPTGQYDQSAGRTCQLDLTWTAGSADCHACRTGCAECTGANTCTRCEPQGEVPRLVHGECRGNDGLSQQSPLMSCMDGRLQGFPNGVYWLRSPTTNRGQRPGYRNRVYQSYCMNVPGLGWTDVAGGGWEILHVQTGGHQNSFRGTPHQSNRAMIGAPNDGFNVGPGNPGDPRRRVDMPVLTGNAQANHHSQMSPAWTERARQVGNDWIKFSVKIYGNTVRGQDHFKVDLGNHTNFPFNWILNPPSNQGECPTAPGEIKISINNVPVGKTTKIFAYNLGETWGSIGLPNSENRCSLESNLRLHTQGNENSAHGFRRIDGGSSDNTMKHFFSYGDGHNGYSSSRCHYCCWGCNRWRETVVWASRPHQPERTN
jgi:hypothetical protein